MKSMSSIKNDFTTTDVNFICAVKECREPKKIAEQLEISPSSINVYVQRIEKKLGKKIFLRKQNPTAIELNEEGLDFYPQCKRASQSFEFLYEKIDSQKDYLQGEIKITATQTILEYFYVPYLVDFIKKNPMIDVIIKQLDDTLPIDQDINEFYFTTEVKDDTSTYAYFPYHAFVQKLWASPKYIKIFGQIESLDDLYRHNLLFQRGSHNHDKVFSSSQIKAALSYHSNQMRTINITGCRITDRLCEEGLGIMSGSLETKILSNLNVEPVLPKFSGDVADVHIKVNKRIITKSLGQFFLDWLFECRDASLRKIKVPPSYQYKKLYVPEPVDHGQLEQNNKELAIKEQQSE